MNRNNPEHWKARIATDARHAASVAAEKQPRCRDCRVELSPECIRRIGSRIGLCDDCRAKHVAAWKDEHTRKLGDKRRGWLIGDKCQVTLKGVTYEATILDMSDTSRRENDYGLMKLELTKTVKGFSGEPYTSTWIHPEPVQSYKLKKCY